MNNFVGEKIKAARLAKGMTQEELGEILGVQKSAIAKYESGRVVNIKRSTLKKISDVLGIPPFELVFDEEHIKKVLNIFINRFFTQQFKRSCSPDGVKVNSFSLSPRGAWRMPSDAFASEWLNEIN